MIAARAIACAASVAAFCAAGSARADEPAPPDAGDPIEVEVVGDKADAIQKIPGSFTVLDREEIEHARPVDTAEMLRRVPGVLVREDTAGGLRLDIGIRGLDPGRSRRLLVLEDGMPLAINPYAEPDLYFVPQIERYSKIEVLKGSGSVLYGPQTVGGVVNFSTHVPPSEGVKSRVSLDVGEYGYVRALGRFAAGVDLGDAMDPAGVLGHVVVKRGDGPRDQTFKGYDALAKVRFPTGDRGAATVKLAAHRTEAVSEDVGLTRGIYELDPRRPALSPTSRVELTRLDLSLTHDIRPTRELALKTLVYGSFTGRVWARQRYDRVPEPGAPYERIVGDVDLPLGAIYFRDETRVLDRSYYVVGIEPRLTARVKTGRLGHTIDGGVRVLTEGAVLDELAGATKRSLGGPLVASEDHRTVAFAGYLQDRLAFLDELVVTPGVRVEHARYERAVKLAPGVVDPGEGTFSATAVIPGLGVTAGVPEFHAFAGMHVGFAPPRATTAITDQGQSEVLDAERSTNWEAGLRARPVPWQRAEATAFLQRFSNQIVPQTTPGGVTELVNGGATQSLGGELSATTELGTAFGIEHAVDLGARGGLLRATFEEGDLEGKLLPYAPIYTVSGNVDVDFAFGFGFGAAVTHVGAHYGDDENTLLPDATGRVGEIPAYTQLDLAARYQDAATGLASSVNVKNVLDMPFVIARRPEGISPSGFRQVIVSVWWNVESR